MCPAADLATELLPHFRANVLRRLTRTHGYYTLVAGHGEPASTVADAMLLIGAACVLAGVPVAPLAFVEHAAGDWRAILDDAAAEARQGLPSWDTLALHSRAHVYTEDEFDRVARALGQHVATGSGPEWQTPAELWRHLVRSGSMLPAGAQSDHLHTLDTMT